MLSVNVKFIQFLVECIILIFLAKQIIQLKNDDIEKLNKRFNENKREISIIQSEAELFEQEMSRLTLENDNLKIQVNKLEKMIYG